MLCFVYVMWHALGKYLFIGRVILNWKTKAFYLKLFLNRIDASYYVIDCVHLPTLSHQREQNQLNLNAVALCRAIHNDMAHTLHILHLSLFD